MRVIYLHGFASSARSTKAAWFAAKFHDHGIRFKCPDFNEPDFRTLTMTRMLARLDAVLGDESATLMGSSLGGALAVLAAERFRERVARLVLMAPAVMFARPGHHLLPAEMLEEWRRKGAMPFFHYGYNDERMLDVSFYEDSLRFEPFAARVDQPAIVFQGVRDLLVDYRTVEAFAQTRPNVTLSLLDDDHQLMASLQRIWTDVVSFLGISG